MARLERSVSAQVAPIYVTSAGQHVIRYGLVLVLLWIGGMKFTAYEAHGIKGLVANCPLLSWAYAVLSVQGFSNLIGVTEVLIGLLIAAWPFSAGLAAAGSALAVGLFLTTLSFLLTTPGVWEASQGGFPALSVVPGQFLFKDVVLLGAALWSFGEAWQHFTRRGTAFPFSGRGAQDGPPGLPGPADLGEVTV
jgi:uncharacterized membrane protein YkgB